MFPLYYDIFDSVLVVFYLKVTKDDSAAMMTVQTVPHAPLFEFHLTPIERMVSPRLAITLAICCDILAPVFFDFRFSLWNKGEPKRNERGERSSRSAAKPDICACQWWLDGTARIIPSVRRSAHRVSFDADSTYRCLRTTHIQAFCCFI